MPGMPGLDDEHPANSSAVELSACNQGGMRGEATHIVTLSQLL